MRLQPPFHEKKGASFVQRKMYFEINLIDNATEELKISIEDLPGSTQKLTYLSSKITWGKTYFGTKLMLPIDKETALNIEGFYSILLRGHVFFGFVYDEP
jgi:hypothetical protein